MRVIAGEYRSRLLKSLPGEEIRPTPDRLRESLFNILAPLIQGARFLDAYAGTGAVGIEALSRGAAHVTFLERSRSAAQLIRENLASLGITARAEVIHGKALRHLVQARADIVFLDPPYSLQKEYDAALAVLGADPPPLVIAQHSSRLELEKSYGDLTRTRVVKQGDNALTFYKPSGLLDSSTSQ
jgi:16S rRNA (guanine(966)-N(2))-methyltransferase RsmD